MTKLNAHWNKVLCRKKQSLRMLKDIKQIQEWGDGKGNVLWFKIWEKFIFWYLSCYSKKQLVIPNTEIEIQSDKVRHGLMRSVTASHGYKWLWVIEVGRPTVHMSSSMSDCMNRWQRAEFILLPHNWSWMNLHVSVDEVTSLFMVLWTLTNFFWVSLMAVMVAKYWIVSLVLVVFPAPDSPLWFEIEKKMVNLFWWSL